MHRLWQPNGGKKWNHVHPKIDENLSGKWNHFNMTETDDAIRPELSVAIILIEDFTLTPLAGFVDALRLAADNYDDSNQVHCSWSFISSDLKPIKASCGLQVTPTETFPDPRIFDYVVVVGGRMKAMRNGSEEAQEYLKKAHELGIPIVALCTGSIVLAEAGILTNHLCCVHFAVQNRFLDLFPDIATVTDRNFVVDRTIITCPGSVAAIDVAAYLIRQHCSQWRSNKALNELLMTPDQSRMYLPERPYEVKLIRAHPMTRNAVKLMELNLGQPVSIDKLAEMVNTTPSRLNNQFVRDFDVTTAQFWRNIRMDHAKSLLLETSRSITWIAYETGFSDGAHFCRTFKKVYNTTPQTFRDVNNR